MASPAAIHIRDVIASRPAAAAANNGVLFFASDQDERCYRSDGTVWRDLPGGLLAYVKYAPGSETIKTTTSTTFADVDASNLVVTFTVPSTGKVLVRVTAYRDLSNTAQYYLWGLREGSSDIASSVAQATRNSEAGMATILITGLTPGTSTTWKLSHAVTGGATGRTIYHDGAVDATHHYGPAIMEVWAA